VRLLLIHVVCFLKFEPSWLVLDTGLTVGQKLKYLLLFFLDLVLEQIEMLVQLLQLLSLLQLLQAEYQLFEHLVPLYEHQLQRYLKAL
jgi:hypothetical protein